MPRPETTESPRGTRGGVATRRHFDARAGPRTPSSILRCFFFLSFVAAFFADVAAFMARWRRPRRAEERRRPRRRLWTTPAERRWGVDRSKTIARAHMVRAAASRPRRRRGPCPRTIRVAAAASSRCRVDWDALERCLVRCGTTAAARCPLWLRVQDATRLRRLRLPFGCHGAIFESRCAGSNGWDDIGSE